MGRGNSATVEAIVFLLKFASKLNSIELINEILMQTGWESSPASYVFCVRRTDGQIFGDSVSWADTRRAHHSGLPHHFRCISHNFIP